MKIRRGDVVFISKIDNSILGKNVQNAYNRPYIVISNNINNEKGPTVTLACLSTRINKINYPMHILLEKRKYPYLSSDSLVFAEQLITINKDLIVERVGYIDEQDKQALNQALEIQILQDYPNQQNKRKGNKVREKRNNKRIKCFFNHGKKRSKIHSKKH